MVNAKSSMLRKLLLVLASLVSAGKPVADELGLASATENELWVTFDRKSPGGEPLVVVARTGNSWAMTLLEGGRVSVINCEADLRELSENGMPRNTARLYDLEDRIGTEPTLKAVRAIHVASVTGEGRRAIYLAHSDALDLSPFLESWQVPGFSCNAAEVEYLPALITLITPTALELQLNGDQIVLASLREKGDDGKKPRNTEFWFYGQRESLDLLIVSLAGYDFLFKLWLDREDGVVLSRLMPATREEFQMLTPIIMEMTQRYGVEYDGWETKITLSD